jgi:hypothetical protein
MRGSAGKDWFAILSLYSLASLMRKIPGGAAAVLLAGVSIHWGQFQSSTYPYTIAQPSSFRHVVIADALGNRSDYFFPVLTGSFSTNVNVSATRGGGVQDATQYLRSNNGHDIHVNGSVQIMGKHLPLMKASFAGLAGPWIEEQVSFAAGGYFWRLTASYEPRFKSLRKTMIQMIQSFEVRGGLTRQTRQQRPALLKDLCRRTVYWRYDSRSPRGYC